MPGAASARPGQMQDARADPLGPGVAVSGGRDAPARAPQFQVVYPIDSVLGEPPEIAFTRNWLIRPSFVRAQM